MNNMISVGIIGAGRIGKIHADNLLRLPQVEVAAISDPFATPELEQWAGERRIGRVIRDSAELMADPAIDAVVICSSTDTHVGLIKQAAQAGKHIFCEKPVSLDLAQTEEAIRAAADGGVLLQIGFNRRFDHNFGRLREHVAAGAIGAPHLIKITSRDPEPPPEAYVRVSGGLFIDMMIHDFDLARFLTGSEVVEVYAQGEALVDPALRQYDDVDTAIATLRFENGALGVIDNSRKAAYGYDQRVEVFGSKGSAAADNDYPNTAVVSTADGVVRDKPLRFFLERYADAYVEEMRQFADAVASGRPLPVTGEDALRAERIALAAKLSRKLGRPVAVGEAPQLQANMAEGMMNNG